MKKVTAQAITEYKKCPVIILNFDYSFIRLHVNKGTFYYRHDYFKPEWYHRLKWRLGFSLVPFPPEELNKIKSAILDDAFEHIDKLLLEKKKNAKKSKRK